MEPAPAASSPNASLVSRIVSGDLQAEAELVARFSPGVMHMIGRQVSEISAAQDIHQEVFRVAIERIRRNEVRDPDRLPGFLCGLARNLVIEHFRERGRPASQPSADAATRIPSGEASQLDRLLAEESAHIVREILRELPNERDRQILFRFYLAEESKDDICRDLDLSSLHFNRVLCRARDRYRELYVKRVT